MADWHPILNLAEPNPGRWILPDAYERPQAEVELRRTDAGVRYWMTRDGQVQGAFRAARKRRSRELSPRERRNVVRCM